MQCIWQHFVRQVFVPSHLGISHNPLEFTDWKDIEAGIKVLQKVILKQAEVC